MQWLYPALLAGYVAVDALAQGGITLRNRQFVPMSEQPAVNRDHHVLMPALYAMLALSVFLSDGRLEWLSLAAMLRVALFDPIISARKGDPLFALGTSALTDKILGRISQKWAVPALRLVALLGAVYMLWRLA